jgi:FkbM family methyltransferase
VGQFELGKILRNYSFNFNSLRKLGMVVAKLIPAGTVVPIFRGPLRGYKWITGAAAGEGKGLSVPLHLSEPEQLDVARRLAPADGICFDIGANVGFYTLLFAKYSKHVFAFEPVPRNIGYLWKMLEVNGVRNATIVPCAVSDSTRLFSLQTGENCALGRLQCIGEQPIAVVSLDDFVFAYKIVPSLLKIDVEGEEMSVLKGAKNLLSNGKPVILLSTHQEALRFECLEFLKGMKYCQVIPLNSHELDRASEFAVIP